MLSLAPGMIRITALLAVALAVPAPGRAQVISDTVSATALTVYPDDLAMVTETRVVDLPAGRSTVRFDGVSDLIIPPSLVLQSFEGVSLERNFDYNLLGRASLFENSIGDNLRLTRIDPGSGETLVQTAEIVSADTESGVVVRTPQGLEGLFCSGLAVGASFEGLPPGLAARPAMTIEVDAETAGPRELVISYLTSGLGWEADYRLDLGETDDLLGWLSVNNRTAKRYEDAALSVVAGTINRLPTTRAEQSYTPPMRAVCWPVGSTKRGTFRSEAEYASGGYPPPPPPPVPMMAMELSDMAEDEIIVTGSRMRKAVQEDFADYKLYRMPGDVTVAAYQTKQVAFLGADSIAAPVAYELDLDSLGDQPKPLSVLYEIDNSRDGPLGRALPEGTVRVFGPSQSNGRVWLGEGRVEDTPVDEDVDIAVGTSPAVFAEREGYSDSDRSESFRVRLTNAAPTPVDVVIPVDARTTVRGAKRDETKTAPTMRVTVPANGETSLRVRRRYE